MAVIVLVSGTGHGYSPAIELHEQVLFVVSGFCDVTAGDCQIVRHAILLDVHFNGDRS